MLSLGKAIDRAVKLVGADGPVVVTPVTEVRPGLPRAGHVDAASKDGRLVVRIRHHNPQTFLPFATRVGEQLRDAAKQFKDPVVEVLNASTIRLREGPGAALTHAVLVTASTALTTAGLLAQGLGAHRALRIDRPQGLDRLAGVVSSLEKDLPDAAVIRLQPRSAVCASVVRAACADMRCDGFQGQFIFGVLVDDLPKKITDARMAFVSDAAVLVLNGGDEIRWSPLAKAPGVDLDHLLDPWDSHHELRVNTDALRSAVRLAVATGTSGVAEFFFQAGEDQAEPFVEVFGIDDDKARSRVSVARLAILNPASRGLWTTLRVVLRGRTVYDALRVFPKTVDAINVHVSSPSSPMRVFADGYAETLYPLLEV